MSMLMMFIMRVRMLVFQRLVRVLVVMSFGQMQPDSYGHQRARRPEIVTR